MDIKHQSLVLDINETRNYTFIKACQGDQKSRYIDCTLTQNGSVISLTSNYRAIVKASINNEVKAINSCTINTTSQVIVVELTSIMLDTPGVLNCEITVQDGQQIVTSQAFAVQVRQSTIANETEIKKSKEYGALVDALSSIADVESKADKVQGLVDNIDKLESANDIVTRLNNVESKETQLETQHKTDVQALTDKANSIVEQANTDRQNFNNSVDEINTTLDTKENVSNKVSEITHPSLDYYPDTKAVFDYVNSKLETPLDDIESLKSGKLDKTDFNTYKTATDKAIADNKKSIKANATAIDKCVSDIANNSALISKNQINVTTDKSTSIVLNDSSDCNIVRLTLYGNSMQSSVPTPTAPVNIDNVTNPKIKLYHKNLFDFSVCTIFINDSATTNSVDRDNCTINFTTSEAGLNSGIYLRHKNLNQYNKGYGVDYTKLNGKSVTLSFDVQSDIECKLNVQFTRSSYTSVNISSTKQRFSVTEVVDMSKLSKAICFYLNNVEATVNISNIQIEVSSIATDYEVCDVNQASADCTLCKVNNIADTLTVNADGTGYITQNLLYERITSGNSQSGSPWRYSTISKRFYRDDTRYKGNGGTPNLLCSHFEAKDNERDVTLDNSIGFTSGTGLGVAIRMLQFDGDISAFENWLDNNEVYILIPLKQPIITELSKEQVDKILSLHTYFPNTTIVADTDCQVEYVADTKNYIDSKFNELATAIVAHESEVN
ncbi:MAG: BppU family phage baseplate upper protein [Ruminococcus sp.]|nr:BppU family phage baseplate upper protein [Ruminococcus sp.]MCI5617898.1 BppU family phage baseplate upper protein [Ruminococcus sp.]